MYFKILSNIYINSNSILAFMIVLFKARSKNLRIINK